MYCSTAGDVIGVCLFQLVSGFYGPKVRSWNKPLSHRVGFKKSSKAGLWENKLKARKHIENNFSNFWCAEKLITKNQYLIKSQMPKSHLLSQNTKTYISNNQTLSTTRGNNIYPSLNLPRMKVVLTMHNVLGVHAFFYELHIV